MLIEFLFAAVLLPASLAADHEKFKNCSRVDFCSTLRSRPLTNDYTIDPGSISYDSNTLTAVLSSDGANSNLLLTLVGLQQSTFRLRVTETDSTRYQLIDVLVGEPETINFDDVQIGDNSVTVTTDSGSNSVVINFSPFNIEFVKDESVEVVFQGDRFTMARNNITAPFSFGVSFPQAYQLYGLHEHCDSPALQNTAPGGTDPYRLKNSDVGGYEINSPMALYGAIPVIYGHGPTATAGIFLHNAAEQWIETTNRQDGGTLAYFMTETGTLDLFVLLGPDPVEVVRQYVALTGTAHLPQMWALGYHQSRYSYNNQEDVKNVTANFDLYNFQMDSIWLDIDYTDGFKYFTWNPNTFSDPVNLQETLDSTNKKLVTIIDPHIKVEEGYVVYDEGLANDLFVKNPDGTTYEGDCWPGLSTWMDFLNPAARDFYSSMYSYDNFQGSTPTIGGIWNDMNEPSVFDGSVEGTLPPDSLHIDNVRHREIHNIYGLLHTKATHQGLMQRDNGERRPFVLTRSHFAGSQRYSAFWTGDNMSDWPYLLASYQQCLNANMLGFVFCGSDIGGFINNPSNELMERWYQAGAWLPFYRAHNMGAVRREPYLYPEDTQVVIRNALQGRYKHLPAWYTLFYEHTRYGDPIIRPLFYQYPEDIDSYNVDNQLLVGKDILVRAVDVSGAQNLDVYFPGGEDEMWFSVNDDAVQMGSGLVNIPIVRDYLPVYYRRGAVIVRRDTIRLNTAEMANDTYTFYYTLNPDSTAHGTMYFDDGVSFQYLNNSNYSYLSIDIFGDSVSITAIDGNGNYDFVVEKFVRRNIVKMPKDGKPGVYEETVFTTDANGQLLKKIKFNSKKPVTVML